MEILLYTMLYLFLCVCLHFDVFGGGLLVPIDTYYLYSYFGWNKYWNISSNENNITECFLNLKLNSIIHDYKGTCIPGQDTW